MMEQPKVYNSQCLMGHTSEVRRETNPALWERCSRREARGFLDALCLGPSECPECAEDRALRENQYAQYWI